MYIPQETTPGVEPLAENTLPVLQHQITEVRAINGTTLTKIFFTNLLMMVPAVTGLIRNLRPLVPQDQQMYKRRPGV